MTGFTVKKIKMKVLLRYAFILTAIGLLGISVIRIFKRKTDTYRAPVPAVKIAKPQIKSVSQGIRLSGYIEPFSSIPVVPLVSGIITDYPAKTGMSVSQGDILAQIDKKPFIQQMLQAKALYESCESAYKRISALYESNAATRQDFETIKAQRDGSKAAYELSLLQLEHADIRSPIDGTVLEAPQAKGNLGAPSQPVALIADLNELVVRLNIPEKYFDLFTDSKTELNVHISRSDTKADGTPISSEAQLDTLSPYIQADTKTFRAVFALKENLNQFKPGMFVSVHIIYKTVKNVPTISLSVLKPDGSCYTYNPENNTVNVHNFPITVKDGKCFMLPEEFKDTWFVLSGQYGIFDGQKVSVLENVQEAPEL